MRFIVMHKVDAKMEAGDRPDPQIISNMGALVQEGLKSGVFVTGAGLHPSRKRARLARTAGEWSQTNGPYPGDNELLASFVMVRAKSMADAVAQARGFAEISGDTELEVGSVVEAWDLGVIPKPADPPQRFLFLSKGDAAFEQGGGVPAQARQAALAELARVLGPDGAVLAAEVLAPSAKGARLTHSKEGKRNWVDGPFAESKELIAGFSILELPSKDDAIAWANRYAEILVDNEVDVREIV